MHKTQRAITWISTLALGSLSAAAVHAADPVEGAEDDTWISLSGTVVSSSDEAFRLDYGEGVVTVEMDDFDFFEEGRTVLHNDEVTVHGMVDNDLFEAKKIEASSVYVESLGTYFYSSSVDEEDFTWATPAPIEIGTTEVTGTVASVDGREFDVSTGIGLVQVDTDEMVFNPMDDKGFLRVEVGDLVKVDGEIDDDLFEKHELEAEAITKLHR